MLVVAVYWKNGICSSSAHWLKSKGINLCSVIRKKKAMWFLVAKSWWTVPHHLLLDIIALSSGWRVGEDRQVHKHSKKHSTFLSLSRSSFPIFTYLSFLHCLQWVYHLSVNKLSDKIATLYLIVQFIYVLLMSPDLNSAFLRGCLINLLANPI